jgi:glycosyltransferase involved in cell wall biosynthesis
MTPLARPGSARPWHVAVVVENVPVGVDTRLRKQVENLLDAGFDVSVITMRHDDNEPYRGRERLRLLEYPGPREGNGPVGYALEYAAAFGWATVMLVRLRLRRRVDVLQLCQPPDIYFPVAWLLRWAGARVVVDQRDLMPETLASRSDSPSRLLLGVLRLLERESRRVAHGTVTVNDYLRNRLAPASERAGVSVVRNGPVLARVDRVAPDRRLRGSEGSSVVWIGKMGPQDRVDLVVRLAEELVHRRGRTDCRFVLLGDGECLHELQRLTTRLRLEPWVEFTGWVPEDTVFRYLATADVGVDTSLQQEVSPVKAMEYMAFGLPFACFDLEESRRTAQGAASFVPPGDVDALATAILRLLDEPVLRQRLGSYGRRMVEQHLSWERQSPAYLAAVSPGEGLLQD